MLRIKIQMMIINIFNEIGFNSRSILVATGLQSVMILSFSSLSSLFRLFKILFLSKMIFKYPRPPPRRDK